MCLKVNSVNPPQTSPNYQLIHSKYSTSDSSLYVVTQLPLLPVVVCRKMSLLNEERKLAHLFDGSDWNVYESKILNLGVGAPGTDLLQYCGDIFRQATEHRLVNNKSFIVIQFCVCTYVLLRMKFII